MHGAHAHIINSSLAVFSDPVFIFHSAFPSVLSFISPAVPRGISVLTVLNKATYLYLLTALSLCLTVLQKLFPLVSTKLLIKIVHG